jgi:hypothetical protein
MKARGIDVKERPRKALGRGYDARMPTRPPRSNRGPDNARNANPKGERLNAKHAKLTAHKPVERRGSNKGR